MLCLLSNPQGKNLQEPEFQAIGDMLCKASWELNQAEEYKNDLVQPSFLGVEAVPKSSAQGLVASVAARADPAGPASDDQWKKVNKMVAWFRFGL